MQVIRFNSETQRISLGMKQLEADPWEGVAAKYPPGAKYSGRVTNITDYGAFVELEPGVEGLVHVSEMSWTKKNVHPGKIVSTSQEVDVMVLDVDSSKRRISLGLKQVQRNPWEQFVDEHPIGSEVEGEIRNITEFGLFIGLSAGHRRHDPHVRPVLGRAGRDWRWPTTRRARSSRPRCSTSMSRRSASASASSSCEDDPAAAVLDTVHKGDVVTCVVTAVQANGIEVKVDDVLTGFIRRAELARDKGDQRPDRFAVGEKVDAKITAVDRAARKLTPDHQGQGGRGGEAGDGRIRLVRLRRLAGRHPGRGDPSPQPAGPDRQLASSVISIRDGGQRVRPRADTDRRRMSLETDLLLDRRRLKRRLFVWRSLRRARRRWPRVLVALRGVTRAARRRTSRG